MPSLCSKNVRIISGPVGVWKWPGMLMSFDLVDYSALTNRTNASRPLNDSAQPDTSPSETRTMEDLNVSNGTNVSSSFKLVDYSALSNRTNDSQPLNASAEPRATERAANASDHEHEHEHEHERMSMSA